ncbi:glycosyltransferase [Paraburkholderia sp. MMS20-SJTR3]|uniref:Glycosyltransferase n=1 Tax=Paraburkholderia sejongensis TaxID=2886946 RepID=A0ABS8JYC0_9BURK|nr:glycosyltransferase [Paraburkholderia sp. MMS20-SJTR3]MCC8394907.1 glycosyltransferase [Paraburkholderia sp. MMS20-SJTR3]
MRLVIDLQACQTEGSRDRGIGRYSFALADAMIRNCRGHEVLIALNRAFPESIDTIQKHFADLLPNANVVLWGGLKGIEEIEPKNVLRRLASERIKEEYFRSLNADIVHTASLFEGFVDSSVTTVAPESLACNAVTLYDLIPYLRAKHYLADERVEDWYRRRLLQLKQADLALAISESSRREGIDHLGLPEHSTVNISSAVDKKFKRMHVSPAREAELRRRFALKKPFIMYTGGIDFRKNIEGLIDAYACLPPELRSTHQLAVVCRANLTEVRRLEAVAAAAGLDKGNVVLTGYVTDDELVDLYNLCKVFIFPSIHEGFGLPALEAMSCGAAVIGSDCTSVPEVIGRSDALFNPLSRMDMAAKLAQALQDDDFRRDLQASGFSRAQTFSWERSASVAWDALESIAARAKAPSLFRLGYFERADKPRLAYVSPLPPERSGIAAYSAMLLPLLSKYYEIDLVHNGEEVAPELSERFPIRTYEEFERSADRYDRVVYHVGNSHFHTDMPRLLRRIPGIVVLHDFFLSGLFWTIEASDPSTHAFSREIEFSHGQLSLLEHLCSDNVLRSLVRYPCNLAVLENAIGVISHSGYSKELAHRWYGEGAPRNWAVIPLLRDWGRQSVSQLEARKRLGIDENAFVVCSFGIVSSMFKLNDRLLQAWSEGGLGKTPNCRLVFVGDCGDDTFNALLLRLTASGQVTNCTVTGYVSDADYQLWLSACDLCVQLRAKSRGETSAAVSDGMGAGKHVIVNAHAALREIPDHVVTKLQENPSCSDLAQALRFAFTSPDISKEIGQRARAYTQEHHDGEVIAAQYHNAIEEFWMQQENDRLLATLSEFRELDDQSLSRYEWSELRNYVEDRSSSHARAERLLVDVTKQLSDPDFSGLDAKAMKNNAMFLAMIPENKRVFFVRRVESGEYEILRDLRQLFMGQHEGVTRDKPIPLFPGEVPVLWEEFSAVA